MEECLKELFENFEGLKKAIEDRNVYSTNVYANALKHSANLIETLTDRLLDWEEEANW